MIMILFKSLRKRTSIGSYYDEKSLTKCYWDGVCGFFAYKKATNSVPVGFPNFVPTGSKDKNFIRIFVLNPTEFGKE